MSSKVLLVVLLVVLMLDTIIKLLFLFFIIKLLHLRNLSSFHPYYFPNFFSQVDMRLYVYFILTQIKHQTHLN